MCIVIFFSKTKTSYFIVIAALGWKQGVCITKIRLFKYIEQFLTKKLNKQINILIFFIFLRITYIVDIR